MMNKFLLLRKLMSSLINKIGLGSVQFGLNYGISNQMGITSSSEVRQILDYSKSVGIDLIDTAHSYGISEEVLGKAGVKSFKIVSKFFQSSPDFNIESQIKTSLSRLKVDQLYGLLFHRPLDVLENPGTWDYLQKLKYDGIVAKIGFSFNTTEEIELILKQGYHPDLIQVPFNYLDNRYRPYMIELKNDGCEIHSRSVFLQGLFFMDPEQLDFTFTQVKPVIKQLQSYGSFMPGMLLKYCLKMPFIDKVILGVNNKNQLVENIASINASGNLPENEIIINHEILTPSRWKEIK